jgi:hypothetical protein
MKDTLQTLVIEASGYGWKTVAFDTLAFGVLGLSPASRAPEALRGSRLEKKITGRLKGHYENLSYVRDWRDAFCTSPQLVVTVCNINNLIKYKLLKDAVKTWPLIIVLHSAFGDNLTMMRRLASWFQDRRGKLAVFIGNEYDMMAEKLSLLKRLQPDYICSQLPLASAQWIYAECRSAKILPLPHALNPEIYSPKPSLTRTFDIGFRGELYPYFIGDRERTHLLRYFESNGPSLGLQCAISTIKLHRTDWSSFLRSTKAIIGGESGTYYLDRRGELIAKAKNYMKSHPDASFDEIFRLFFALPPTHYVSGKCISSRHFEPIGTKTCQILLEGDYNGILKADEHYISIKKDLSNADDAVMRFKDHDYRMAMVNRAYEYILHEHTYAHRVQAFLQAVS